MTPEHFQHLLQLLKHGQLDERGWRDLLLAIEQGEHDELLSEDIMETIGARKTDPQWTTERETSILKSIKSLTGISSVGEAMAPSSIQGPVLPMGPRLPFRWAAAAAVMILAGSATFFLLFNKPKNPAPVARIIQNDAGPGTNKATLTLSNGSRIILDSVHDGLLANESGSSIVKTDSGRLTYNMSNSAKTSNILTEKPTDISFNTLTTPRGGQFQLSLPDGTKVWLNAASSIKYPTAFTGTDRPVSITGEAYFEVAHNAAKPFIVKVAGQEVRVLGTHFNINAYTDESAVKTTLLEGSVKVTAEKNNQSIIIKPGQQADLTANQLSINKQVNLDEIISWKEGSFHFESADLPTILRQFSRWYNVDVVYEGTPTNRKFFGIVKRSNSLSRVLEMLQDNNIEYRIEGNKLIVKSS